MVKTANGKGLHYRREITESHNYHPECHGTPPRRRITRLDLAQEDIRKSMICDEIEVCREVQADRNIVKSVRWKVVESFENRVEVGVYQ